MHHDILLTVDYHDQNCVIRKHERATCREQVLSVPTTAQSLVLDRAWGRGRDAPAVARLKAAGAVIVGKTTTMEFAIGLPDPQKPFVVPRNPWDLSRWPGGSSSGTGSGIAAGLFLAGVGTDTGGSSRIPAAMCGVTGLMPTPTMTSSFSGAPTDFQNSAAFCFVPKRIFSNGLGNSFARKPRILPDSDVPALYSIPA